MSELTFTVSEKDLIRTKFRLNEQQCEISSLLANATT